MNFKKTLAGIALSATSFLNGCASFTESYSLPTGKTGIFPEDGIVFHISYDYSSKYIKLETADGKDYVSADDNPRDSDLKFDNIHSRISRDNPNHPLLKYNSISALEEAFKRARRIRD